jgi:putative restriction endonuclease
MSQLLIQPSGGKNAQVHYEDTIRNLVSIDSCADVLSEAITNELNAIFPEGKCAFWGLVPGSNDSNRTKWEKIQPGDVVVFTGKKRVFATGIVKSKFQNAALATRLWGIDDNSATWEYMYALSDIAETDIPYSKFNELLGDSPNNNHMGFRIVDDLKASGFISYVRSHLPITPPSAVPIGTVFASRMEVRKAGLHPPPMAGIYPAGDGARAESIVISGGYKDDKDYGEVIIYTGQGGQENGRQVRDQEIKAGNKALVRAQNDGTPVRVIRGSGGDSKFSPSSGFRYDGLFEIRDHWFTPSEDGPLVIQFELIAVDHRAQSTVITSDGSPTSPPGNLIPDRREKFYRSLVRDQSNVDWIKNLYDNTCQVCRIKLMTDAGAISIAAHIQGLGKPHNGPDVIENMLCLCHNCHAIFDSGAFYINNDCRTISWLQLPEGGDTSAYSNELFSKPQHQIGLSFIQSHRVRVAGKAEIGQ